MKQRVLKQIADSRGVLLRPQDSNAVGGGAGGKKILGAGRKRAAGGPGAARNADALLGAGGRRGGDVDPLTKKVKVRFCYTAVACVEGKERRGRKGGRGVAVI